MLQRLHGPFWVCENHPAKPWDGPDACGCGGAGATSQMMTSARNRQPIFIDVANDNDV